ncbi:AN1-type zinc finger protein 1-like [Clytia hemisphaerica]|uniref:AN1-type domain-containing protein n=1 Tax=Clytia hemisphaerica TaxID=252671 RepID=A0A7M5VDS8_9CNID
MAELMHIGKHCGHSECNQLDFLPIQCQLCKKVFCSLHVKSNEHGCKSQDNILTDEDVQNLTAPASFSCTYGTCKGRELTPITCDKCIEQFCLKHRLPGDHECKQMTLSKKSEYDGLTAKEKVEKITGKSLVTEKTSGRVGKKSTKTSNKVLEMKLKMKAKGENSIPIPERIYFEVKFNIESCKTKSLPLFFSKEYTIGRIIDLIAKYAKLLNQNHVSTAPKLRLYVEDGVYFPVDSKLKNLLEEESNGLRNFGEIEMKYVK